MFGRVQDQFPYEHEVRVQDSGTTSNVQKTHAIQNTHVEKY